jgi:hypothetical protein
MKIDLPPATPSMVHKSRLVVLLVVPLVVLLVVLLVVPLVVLLVVLLVVPLVVLLVVPLVVPLVVLLARGFSTEFLIEIWQGVLGLQAPRVIHNRPARLATLTFWVMLAAVASQASLVV